MNNYALLSLFLLTLFLQNGFITSIEPAFKREIIGDLYQEKRANVPIGNVNRRQIRQKRENSLHLRHRKLVHPQQRNFESDHESKDRHFSDSYHAQSQIHDTTMKRSTQDVYKSFKFSNSSSNIRNNYPNLDNFRRRGTRKRRISARKIVDPNVRNSIRNSRKIVRRRKIHRPKILEDNRNKKNKNPEIHNETENLFHDILNEVATTVKSTADDSLAYPKVTSIGRTERTQKSRTFSDLNTKASMPNRVAIKRTKLPQRRQNSLPKQSLPRQKVEGPFFESDHKFLTDSREYSFDIEHEYLDEYFEDIQNLFDEKFSQREDNDPFLTPANTVSTNSLKPFNSIGKQLSHQRLIPTPVKSSNKKKDAVLKSVKNPLNNFIRIPPPKPESKFVRNYFPAKFEDARDGRRTSRKRTHENVKPKKFTDVEHGPRPSIESSPVHAKSPKVTHSRQPSNQATHQPSHSSKVTDYDFNYENYNDYDYNGLNYEDTSNILDNFKYGYKINAEESGNFQTRTEERDGKTVSGTYEVALPDGRIQIVKYIADGNGFRADVTYVDKDDHLKKSEIFNKSPAHLPTTRKQTTRNSHKKKSSAFPKSTVKKQSVTRESKTIKRILPEFEDAIRKNSFRSGNQLFKTGNANIRKDFSRSNNRITTDQNIILGRSIDSRLPHHEFTSGPTKFPKLNSHLNLLSDKEVEEEISPGTFNLVNSHNEIFNNRKKFNSFQNKGSFRTPPKPKPIPPPGHRQVAKRPPNPFLKKQSKHIHKPVPPNPKQIGKINPFIKFPDHVTPTQNRVKSDEFNNNRKPNAFLGNRGFNTLNREFFEPHVKAARNSQFTTGTNDQFTQGINIQKQRFSKRKSAPPLRSLSPSFAPPTFNKHRFPDAHLKSLVPTTTPSLHVQPPRSNFESNNIQNDFRPSPRFDHFNHVKPNNNVFSHPPSTSSTLEAQDIPIIFQYTSNNGEVSPPLFYNPSVPVYVKSLGQTHSIPLLLPIHGNHVSVKRRRRKPQIEEKLSESELFLNRPDIYPQPRRNI